jgi:hypothetical protein
MGNGAYRPGSVLSKPTIALESDVIAAELAERGLVKPGKADKWLIC